MDGRACVQSRENVPCKQRRAHPRAIFDLEALAGEGKRVGAENPAVSWNGPGMRQCYKSNGGI